MKEISVAIITRDERANIEACLRSVEWAGEAIVVDQFSTDGTAEIAASLGAKVYQEPWRGFAGQKNIAVDKAKGTWILSLDADERITERLKREIEEAVHAEDAKEGYYIARKNFFCGKWIRHGGWFPDYTLRLFRKDAGRFVERSVHERVLVHGRTGHLKHPMEHYTYRSIGDYILRMERYSRLAAREIAAGGADPAWPTLVLRPLFTFMKMYVLRRGFLDGRAGFFLAVSYAYYTFLKYARVREERSEVGQYC